MIEYRFAAEQDREELLDLINMVFSMDSRPHNFEMLLPKVYGKGRQMTHIHAVAVDNGRLCGCVGVYGFPMCVGRETLQVGFVGSVAVHPRMRGRGVMKQLMNMCIGRAREEGMDLLALSGRRQRYEYYGFSPVGSMTCYALDAANLHHAFGKVDAQGIAFGRMQKEDVPFAFALYGRQTVHGARTLDNFQDTLLSFGNTPWMVMDGDRPVGYLVASAGNDRICELVLTDAGLTLPVLKAWMQQMNADVQVDALPYDLKIHEILAQVSETFAVKPSSSLLCLRFDRVVRAFMQLKNDRTPLAMGSLCLKIDDLPTLLLEVRNGSVQVEETNGEAHLTLGRLEAQQLFFSADLFGMAQKRMPTPMGWFPLPFAIPEPDTF